MSVEHAYVGRCGKCRGIELIAADLCEEDPGERRRDGALDLAREVSAVIRSGGYVERVTLDEARKGGEWCGCGS